MAGRGWACRVVLLSWGLGWVLACLAVGHTTSINDHHITTPHQELSRQAKMTPTRATNKTICGTTHTTCMASRQAKMALTEKEGLASGSLPEAPRLGHGGLSKRARCGQCPSCLRCVSLSSLAQRRLTTTAKFSTVLIRLA
ncbi:hypothetical protein V8C86DRAFT_342609 [Haematococcus lacustris]